MSFDIFTSRLPLHLPIHPLSSLQPSQHEASCSERKKTQTPRSGSRGRTPVPQPRLRRCPSPLPEPSAASAIRPLAPRFVLSLAPALPQPSAHAVLDPTATLHPPPDLAATVRPAFTPRAPSLELRCLSSAPTGSSTMSTSQAPVRTRCLL